METVRVRVTKEGASLPSEAWAQVMGTGGAATGRLYGFQFFWSKFVYGFDPSVHCAPCLVGSWGRVIRKDMLTGVWLEHRNLGKWDYWYICGVATPWNWSNNFHMAMARSQDPEAVARMRTYNGFLVEVPGMDVLEIPWAPDGTLGKDRKFTTCRNWQFGLARYGANSVRPPSLSNGREKNHGRWGQIARRCQSQEELSALLEDFWQISMPPYRQNVGRLLALRAVEVARDSADLAWALAFGRQMKLGDPQMADVSRAVEAAQRGLEKPG